MTALILKVTILLALAAGASALLRGRAAARHFIWAAALGASLVLAVLTPLAPALRVEVDEARFAAMIGEPLPTAEPRTGEVPSPAPAQALTAPAAGAASGGAALSNPSSAARPRVTFDWRGAVPAIWIGGMVLLLAWLGVGHVVLSLIARRARALDGESWRRLLADTDVPDSVRLMTSPAVGTPITWGARRPIVLLPADADQWPEDRKRVVLLHELAHVARGDYLAQIIAGVAVAIYWFNPLVWYAAKRMRMESERACDDLVLARGVAGTDYASHLLEIARAMRGMRLVAPAAVGMARRSQLEERLLAVLGTVRSRADLPVWMKRTVAAALLPALIPLAGLRAELRRASGEPLIVSAPVVAIVPAESPVVEGLASSAIVVPNGVQSVARNERPQNRTFLDSVEASPGELLVLDLRTGGSVRVRGWDRPMVRVNGVLRGRDWEDTDVTLRRERAEVRLSSEFRSDGQSSSHRFEIMVPRKFDIRLRSAGGGIDVEDVEGTFRGNTGGGEILLRKVRGTAELSTGGGEIEVSDSHLSGRVNTGGGRVELTRVSGGLRGSSGSGPVIFTEAGPGQSGTGESFSSSSAKATTSSTRRSDRDSDADESLTSIMREDGGERLENWPSRDFTDVRRRGRVHISRAGGAIRLDSVPDGAVVSTGGGDIDIDGGRGVVAANTGGGDITIGPIAGSVRARTGAGAIYISIAGAHGVTHMVDASSGKGKIVIELPASFSGRFELETAYTRRFGRKTVIHSDWDLERRETDEWDDDFGTPRKFVRARGTIGNGNGLVRVRTVNADVTVRRAGR